MSVLQEPVREPSPPISFILFLFPVLPHSTADGAVNMTSALRGFLSRRSVVDNVISRVCSGRNLQTEGFAVQRVAQGALRDIFDIDQFLHLPVVGQLPGQGTKAGSGVIRGGIGQFLRVCLRGRFFAY